MRGTPHAGPEDMSHMRHPDASAAQPADYAHQQQRRSPRPTLAKPAAPGEANVLMKGSLPWPVRLYLFCVIVPLWFNVGPLVLSTLRLYLLIVIVPLSVQLIAGRFGRVTVPDIFLFLHMAWAALALTINSPSQAVQQVGSVGTELLGGYLLARAYIRRIEDFLALCRWLMIIVFVLLPFAIYETLTGRALILEAINALPGVFATEIIATESRMGLDRVQAVFAHPIHFGLFCSIVFALNFVSLKGLIPAFQRWASAAVVGISAFLALSSGALLAILLQFGLILWAAIFNRIVWRWWLLLGLGGVAYVFVDVLSNRTPIQVFLSYATFSAHNAFWRGLIFEWGIANVLGSAEKEIPSSMLFGIGMNDWIRPIWMHTSSMDNFWLVITVRYGVPGFLLLAVPYVWWICRVLRVDLGSNLVLLNARRAWIFTFVGLTFTLCTVHVWGPMYSFIFFMFGAGVWIVRQDAVETSGIPDAREALQERTDAASPDSEIQYSRFQPKHERRSNFHG